MQVKIALHQDQVNVNFTSPHAQVRDALDLQLNRLRDMFAEQGMNLVNVDVSDKSFRQQEREERGSAATEPDVDTDTQSDGTVTQVVNLRLVDHYA